MKWPEIATFLFAHAVAAGTYLVLFLAVPAVLGVVTVVLLLIGGNYKVGAKKAGTLEKSELDLQQA